MFNSFNIYLYKNLTTILFYQDLFYKNIFKIYLITFNKIFNIFKIYVFNHLFIHILIYFNRYNKKFYFLNHHY